MAVFFMCKSKIIQVAGQRENHYIFDCSHAYLRTYCAPLADISDIFIRNISYRPAYAEAASRRQVR